MFSSRLPASLAANAVSAAIAALRRSGVPFLDLTESNPTAVGLTYPPDLVDLLADPRARRYEPEPFGLRSARQAVAEDYRRRGRDVPVDRLALTASTSEAYALLFKLLCDPGDEVLVPQPSYPLFDLLAGLEGVVPRPYRLEYHGRWSIDRASLERALGPRTRAVLVVSPNNPTGSILRQADRDWLAALSADRPLAIIVDEVFADFPLAPRADACAVTGREPALTFSLGGLSKSAGLPQLKLGWIAAGGPAPLVDDALTRLEVICDTYLSVGSAVQWAAPAIVDRGAAIRAGIHARVSENLRHLRETLLAWPAVTLLEPEAGWSAILRVPAIEAEEALVLRLLRDAQVLVHPGYMFDVDREACLVVSLLPESHIFHEALTRMLRALPQGTR